MNSIGENGEDSEGISNKDKDQQPKEGKLSYIIPRYLKNTCILLLQTRKIKIERQTCWSKKLMNWDTQKSLTEKVFHKFILNWLTYLSFVGFCNLENNRKFDNNYVKIKKNIEINKQDGRQKEVRTMEDQKKRGKK